MSAITNKLEPITKKGVLEVLKNCYPRPLSDGDIIEQIYKKCLGGLAEELILPAKSKLKKIMEPMVNYVGELSNLNGLSDEYNPNSASFKDGIENEATLEKPIVSFFDKNDGYRKYLFPT